MSTCSELLFNKSNIQFIRDAIDPQNLSLALGITSTMHYSEIVIRAMAGIKSGHFLTHTSFFSIAAVPLLVNDISNNLKEFSKASLNEKTNIFLRIVSNTSSIGYGMWTFLSALQNVGVSSRFFSFLPILGIASAALQALSITLDAKGLIESYRFSKELNNQANLAKKVQDYCLKDFQGGLKFIKQENNVDIVDKEVTDYLLAVEEIVESKLLSADIEDTSDKELLFNTMQTLQKRITLKKWSHALYISAATIDLLGVGLLFSPAALAGSGCFAISGVICTSLAIYKRRNPNSFPNLPPS